MQPLVSIVMPIYNCEPFLKDAIRSMLNQTYSDFELIGVNDGSTDSSGSVLEHFAAIDSRVVAVHQPNGGIVSALNTGLAISKGSLIARMDGDDISLPERIELQVHYFQQHSEISAVGTGAQFIDEQGIKAELHLLPTSHEEINTALSDATYAILHPTLMVKAGAIRAVGGYDPAFRIAEDLDLFLRLGERFRLANLPEVLLLYRRRAHSQTRNYRATCAEWDQQALRAAKVRGRTVPQRALAQLSDRASWAAASEGDYHAALRHALSAMQLAPLSAASWRPLLRLPWRMLKKQYA